MNTRILIVDDEAPARTRLRDVLSDIAQEFAYELVGEAENGPQALGVFAANPAQSVADVVLLDVQMPGMNGLEVAGHLNRLSAPPAVIFTTAFDEFALKAFEVHALDYLMKPVRAQRLLEALQRAARLTTSKNAALATAAHQQALSHGGRDFISVPERNRLSLIPVTDIRYFKAELKYVTIRTPEREHLIEESLVNLEEEFAQRFVRVHRNALVARDAIIGFERIEVPQAEGPKEAHWGVVLRDIPERLQVSRRQWSIVKELVRK